MATILQGVLERIIYFNNENHYCIGELRQDDTRTVCTITGVLPGVQCGETLKLEGAWNHHKQYGPQFKVEKYSSTLPASVYGIRKYLGSGLVPGIGKGFANKIVDAFGMETLRIISEDSGRLREVPGIGYQRTIAIKKAWDEQQAVRDVMMFLQTYGVSVANCLRLVRQYGNAARRVLETDPYLVAREIPGIGFKTADKIAINLGFANDSEERLGAGVIFSMQALEDDGHTGFSKEGLCQYAAKLLEVEEDMVTVQIDRLLEAKSLLIVQAQDLVQLPFTYHAEQKIAESIHRLKFHSSQIPPIKIEAAVDWAQGRVGFEFAVEQAVAIRRGLESKLNIITGGPGTGKTTILLAIVDILKAKKVRVVLASPTGRAAQRMSETTGHFAQTIHRLLKFDPILGRFTTDESNPLKGDFFIFDETSMLDTRLAAALFRSIPAQAHVILVGDADQLPSVGAGNVLRDLIASDSFSVTRLNRIFRQKETSGIIRTAHGILTGNSHPPPMAAGLNHLKPGRDIQMIKALSPEECLKAVISLCKDWIPAHSRIDPIRDLQVIAPMHRGIAGITNLNQELQRSLNPQSTAVTMGNHRFSLGDKVIQTRNNYDKNIFNGDLGKICALNIEAGTVAVDFDGTIHDLERLELTDLLPAYAISVHKSQGSEFPIVILPILKQHYMMLQRNLLYTAVTRGKMQVFIVGDPAAYAMAVGNVDSRQRVTDLKGKLMDGNGWNNSKP